jgi:serine/threonine protein kinase
MRTACTNLFGLFSLCCSVVSCPVCSGDTLDSVWAVYAYPAYHSLLHHLRANKRFPEKIVRHFAAQTVSLFKELHIQGLICRNLSPENMYLDGKGNAVLCDFFLTQQNTKKIPPVHAVEYESMYYRNYRIGSALYSRLSSLSYIAAHPCRFAWCVSV